MLINEYSYYINKKQVFSEGFSKITIKIFEIILESVYRDLIRQGNEKKSFDWIVKNFENLAIIGSFDKVGLELILEFK